MTTDTDIIEAEVIGRELIAAQPTVALAVTVDEALEQWRDYQRLTRELLDDTDYQAIGNRRFKKKSAWRKYARAFNITDRVTFEDIKRDDAGFPLWARIRVEARANNGRTAEADHECHVTERCCERPCRKTDWRGHTCCPEDCNGKRHWSHPGDLPATALTRAKNRAISDLIGAGEVSAEEMTERHVERTETAREVPKPEQADVRPPNCKQHGAMRFRKAGVSKGGKPYPSFWSCIDRECNVSVNHADWLSQSKQMNTPSTETADLGDIPFDE